MLTPLNRIIMFVGNVEKCGEFYERVFGFNRIDETYTENEWLELQAGPCKLAFHKAHGATGPIDAPTGSELNPHKIGFYSQNVAETREELMRAGVKMGETHRFGELEFCDGFDPENHRFQISNRK